MALCRPDSVLQRVAAALHVAVANLAPEWTSLANEATRDAAADLTTLLAMKGYSQAQITQADQFSAWQERIAFVVTMQRGAALTNYSQESLKALDPREAIEKAGAILIGGVPTAADGTSAVGGVSNGRVSAADCELRRGWRDGGYYGG